MTFHLPLVAVVTDAFKNLPSTVNAVKFISSGDYESVPVSSTIEYNDTVRSKWSSATWIAAMGYLLFSVLTFIDTLSLLDYSGKIVPTLIVRILTLGLFVFATQIPYLLKGKSFHIMLYGFFATGALIVFVVAAFNFFGNISKIGTLSGWATLLISVSDMCAAVVLWDITLSVVRGELAFYDAATDTYGGIPFQTPNPFETTTQTQEVVSAPTLNEELSNPSEDSENTSEVSEVSEGSEEVDVL